MNNSNGGKFCTNLSVFFYLFPFYLVWLIYFKLWQKRNECISIEFFFCPFYFKSIKYVIICCFLCCSIEFRYVLLNEMMRMTGKIKLSTMKKIFNPRYTNRSGLMRYMYTFFGSFYTICDFPLCYSWTTVTIRFGFYFIYFSARVKYCLVNSYKMWQFKQRGKNGDFERYSITVNSESIVGWPQSKQLWRDVEKKEWPVK